ncbi:hypothetical protein LAZ40_09925 [Cereibacter sphaeroides]|uniref:hypothetical protein n=1 Tax=Cereibacter sphaeroides TaxID=1063 RepID=UPI001F1E0193|nr:hypothetical protein [Cereibacter sphaeroides]MCE6959369.1 hypothetical protein [Cereibacter sphaeroides]MCE6972961.1 hypothetical protein [Cereibacter sphaeroides]
MSLHLPTDCSFSGVPGETVAEFLHRILTARMRLRGDEQVCFRSPDVPEDGRSCLEACLAHELVEASGDGWRVLPAGIAVSRAVFRPRVPLSEAEASLGRLLERFDAIEAETPFRIGPVWLFGSLLRREREIGDIDMAVDYGFDTSRPEPEARAWLAAERTARGLGSDDELLLDLIRRVADPLHDGVFVDSFDLRALGVPCQCFEREGGSWSRQALLATHPRAFGVSERDARCDLVVRTDQGLFVVGNEGSAAGDGAMAPEETAPPSP